MKVPWRQPRGWKSLVALCIAIRLIPILIFPYADFFDLASYGLVGQAVAAVGEHHRDARVRRQSPH